MNGDYYVYRLWDAKGRLLYVGCSRNLLLRRHDHRRLQFWWQLVARWTLVGPFRSKRAALDCETAAIRNEVPRFNDQGNVNLVVTRAERREIERLKDERWSAMRRSA